ncbi:NTF2 fold immunity protein [Pseudomonas sp. NPDC089401]|uniref:NTF2 fold immunity protein n=1 Tax=Pseudomonas sp. NPDC089401 TaxID=3364462 RepID=UPI003803B8DE
MEVREFLEQFLEQMLAWEMGFHKRRRSDEYKSSNDERLKADFEAKAKLREIFDSCLSRKANRSLASSRLELLNTGRSPEFAQAIIPDSCKESEGKVFVETINAKALAPLRRYTVIVEDEKFKIDELHGRANEMAKWSSRESI